MNKQKSKPFVRLDSVEKVFNINGKEFLAVKDVSLNIMEGDLVSIVGPSGCGKSTILSMVAGLFEAHMHTLDLVSYVVPHSTPSLFRHITQDALNGKPCNAGSQCVNKKWYYKHKISML